MSQSERERALRDAVAAVQAALTSKALYDLNGGAYITVFSHVALPMCARAILALIDQPAALDTPQEPTPAENSFVLKDAKIYQAALPAAPPGLEKFLSELEVEAGDYNRRFEESTKRQEYITAAQQGGVAAAYRNVVVRLRALAAAPRPALSPDARIKNLLLEHRPISLGDERIEVINGHECRSTGVIECTCGAPCKFMEGWAEHFIEALAAPAPREGA